MAHPHDNFRLHPLRPANLGHQDCCSDRGEPSNPILQLISSVARQNKERCSRKAYVLSAAPFCPSKISNRLPLIIVICSQQDQLALDHVLGLEPELGGATFVWAERPFGDDALEAHGTGLLEQDRACALPVVAE